MTTSLQTYLGLFALLITNICSLEREPRFRSRRPFIDKRGLPEYQSLHPQHSYPQHSGPSYTSYYHPQPQPSHGPAIPSGHNSLASLYSGYSLNFAPAQTKTGPVTFDNPDPGTSSPYYVTSMQDPGKYQGQAIQILLGALQSSQKGQNLQPNNAQSSSILGPSGHASAIVIPTPQLSPLLYTVPVPSPSYESSQSSEGYKLPMTTASYSSEKYSPASSSGSAYVSKGKGYSSPYTVASYPNSILNYATTGGSADQDEGSITHASTAQLKALISQFNPAKTEYAAQTPQYYTRYASEKNPESYAGTKYDTISYSSINGKY